MRKWIHKSITYQIADTGDYDGHIQFENGKDVYYTHSDEIEEEDLNKFCELLDLTPDFQNERLDVLEVEYSIFKSQFEEVKRRHQIILTEPNGIVRDTMIFNLLNELP